MLAQLAKEDHDRSMADIHEELQIDKTSVVACVQGIVLKKGEMEEIQIDLQCIICFNLPNYQTATTCIHCRKFYCQDCYNQVKQ
jgi:hypothetical protein